MSKGVWFHSWYVDTLFLHSVPVIFATLAALNLPPFGEKPMYFLVSCVLVIDWAHIYAQWFRIYSNPVETKRLKWIFPLSFLALIPIITVLVENFTSKKIELFLIYFVIFHFIKQQYGYIRIYGKIDGRKSGVERFIEDTLIYSSMVCPVIYWHIAFPKPDFHWKRYFIDVPFIHELFWLAATFYGVSFLGYCYYEIQRSFRLSQINIAKNLALFSAALGWGIVTFMSHTPYLIFFTVVLSHDLSYVVFVWLIGRRDQVLVKKKVPLWSWFSLPGAIAYLFLLIYGAQAYLNVHLRLIGSRMPNILYGKLFDFVTYHPGWLESLGFALFFSTQAHHYFIDRYLWKKEKDLEYLVKTGKYSLPSVD